MFHYNKYNATTNIFEYRTLYIFLFCTHIIYFLYVYCIFLYLRIFVPHILIRCMYFVRLRYNHEHVNSHKDPKSNEEPAEKFPLPAIINIMLR